VRSEYDAGQCLIVQQRADGACAGDAAKTARCAYPARQDSAKNTGAG